jgi:hypothetical protein
MILRGFFFTPKGFNVLTQGNALGIHSTQSRGGWVGEIGWNLLIIHHTKPQFFSAKQRIALFYQP